MKRSPLKRKTPMATGNRKPIAKTSKKKRSEIAERKKLRAEIVDERGSGCQARVPEICRGLFSDMHEILSRGRGGNPLDKNNILLVCRPCHEMITKNTVWAESKGFLRKATPEDSKPVNRKERDK